MRRARQQERLVIRKLGATGRKIVGRISIVGQRSSSVTAWWIQLNGLHQPSVTFELNCCSPNRQNFSTRPDSRQGCQSPGRTSVKSHQIHHDGCHSTSEFVGGCRYGGEGKQDPGRTAVDAVGRWWEYPVVECRGDPFTRADTTNEGVRVEDFESEPDALGCRRLLTALVTRGQVRPDAVYSQAHFPQ